MSRKPKPFKFIRKGTLSNRKSRWKKRVTDLDYTMVKHIYPKLASDIILPIETIQEYALDCERLGKYGEGLYDEGVNYKMTHLFLEPLKKTLLRLEEHSRTLRDLAESMMRGPVPAFPYYDCKFLTGPEPVLTNEEKINRIMQREAMKIEDEILPEEEK